MIYTTLNRIREKLPCAPGYRLLLSYLGKTEADDEPLAMAVILESNGLEDALWCLRSVSEESLRWQLMAVAFARNAQHLMTDPRSLAALDVAERYVRGTATDEELAVARDAARDAVNDAARAAARAATIDAVSDITIDAVSDATRGAAIDAVNVAVSVAAIDAAKALAWSAAHENMKKIFLEYLELKEL